VSATEVRLRIDGVPVVARAGQTIIAAADDAGIYIPRLCYTADLPPAGACRLCTCKINGRFVAACVTPVAPGLAVENDTPELNAQRRTIVEMLFVEGNHQCAFCERSGACELQAEAYRLGLPAMELTYQFPRRAIDASHAQLFLDRNTCIQCGLCVRASQHADGKSVFGFAGRGAHTQIAVNSPAGLGGTDASIDDRAVAVCPVAAIVVKRTGYQTPVGKRRYDATPIGADIEARREPRDSIEARRERDDRG